MGGAFFIVACRCKQQEGFLFEKGIACVMGNRTPCKCKGALEWAIMGGQRWQKTCVQLYGGHLSSLLTVFPMVWILFGYEV